MGQNVSKEQMGNGELVEAVKLIVDTTPNDMELGGKIRQVFRHVEIKVK